MACTVDAGRESHGPWFVVGCFVLFPWSLLSPFCAGLLYSLSSCLENVADRSPVFPCSPYVDQSAQKSQRLAFAHTQFAKYIEAGVEPDSLEDMYKAAHEAIRADPSHKPTEKKVPDQQKKYHRYVTRCWLCFLLFCSWCLGTNVSMNLAFARMQRQR
jgi:hypothetical protein